MRIPVNRHTVWQVAVDAVLVAAAWWLAWHLRFDEVRPRYYDHYLELGIVLLVVGIKLPVFLVSGFYNRWWRYVSTRDMWTALRGVVLGSVAVPNTGGWESYAEVSTALSGVPTGTQNLYLTVAGSGTGLYDVDEFTLVRSGSGGGGGSGPVVGLAGKCLEIDGGVKADNIAEVKAAGADTYVSGSGIFGFGNDSDPHRYDSIIGEMRAAMAAVSR